VLQYFQDFQLVGEGIKVSEFADRDIRENLSKLEDLILIAEECLIFLAELNKLMPKTSS
jgi:hypothetical protein